MQTPFFVVVIITSFFFAPTCKDSSIFFKVVPIFSNLNPLIYCTISLFHVIVFMIFIPTLIACPGTFKSIVLTTDLHLCISNHSAFTIIVIPFSTFLTKFILQSSSTTCQIIPLTVNTKFFITLQMTFCIIIVISTFLFSPAGQNFTIFFEIIPVFSDFHTLIYRAISLIHIIIFTVLIPTLIPRSRTFKTIILTAYFHFCIINHPAFTIIIVPFSTFLTKFILQSSAAVCQIIPIIADSEFFITLQMTFFIIIVIFTFFFSPTGQNSAVFFKVIPIFSNLHTLVYRTISLSHIIIFVIFIPTLISRSRTSKTIIFTINYNFCVTYQMPLGIIIKPLSPFLAELIF